jgi:TetR/AcrR family transcriptional regulator
MELSRARPEASRLFANEILHGAPAIGDFLTGPLKALVDEKAAVVRRWIAEGRLAPIDPHHLIFAIWATTQHYADFDVQVRAVLGDRKEHMEAAQKTLLAIMRDGLRPR